jgi:hypothetical protein
MVVSSRCLHCGKRLVPFHAVNGRTEFKCVWCFDSLQGGGQKWANNSLAESSFAKSQGATTGAIQRETA